MNLKHILCESVWADTHKYHELGDSQTTHLLLLLLVLLFELFLTAVKTGNLKSGVRVARFS